MLGPSATQPSSDSRPKGGQSSFSRARGFLGVQVSSCEYVHLSAGWASRLILGSWNRTGSPEQRLGSH